LRSGAARQSDDRSAACVHLGGGTRVAREVGTEGKLAVRRRSKACRGVWKDSPVGQPDGRQLGTRRCANRRGDDAVASGDCIEDHRRRSRARFLREGSDQHDGRAAALVRIGVTRVARGRTEGKSAARPSCRVSRVLERDLTTNVNSMASKPTGQVRKHRRGPRPRSRAANLSRSHRRSAGRDPRAEEHDQHDGRSVERLRSESRASRARSAPRGKARRSAQGQASPVQEDLTDNVNGWRRNLTGQGAQHRRGHDRARRANCSRKINGRRQGRESPAQKTR